MDEEKASLQLHPSYRFVSPHAQFPRSISLGRGIAGQVAEMGQPLRVGNIESIENYPAFDEGTSSALCVPIRLKDRVLGVINLESARFNTFSLDDELLLGTLAGQLATAIEQLRAAAAERQWLNQLAHSNDLIYALVHITVHIEKALNPNKIVQVLGKELKKLDLLCAMAVYDSRRKLLRFNYTSMESESIELLGEFFGLSLERYYFYLDKMNLGGHDQNSLQATVLSNPDEEIKLIFAQRRKRDFSRILEGLGIDTEVEVMRLPLMFEENLLGILWVWGKSITKLDLPAMSIFAKQIGIAVESARLFQEAQSLSLTDSLTGLSNGRSVFQLGKIEFTRANRLNHPFCCIMLDLYYFKQINDNFGHPMGDQVLQQVAKLCKCIVREADLIGRYGGEEFIILLPEIDSETAMQVAERLRASIQETPIKVAGQELSVTASIGVSRKDENTLELETLIARADQALYIAKHKGRNHVAISV